MTDSSAIANDEPVIADGVDEITVESNRRLLTRWRGIAIASFSAIYAAFHIAALNGLSLEAITGLHIGFLPSFPLETWNFRIVHIAGALTLGFLLYSANRRFREVGNDNDRPRAAYRFDQASNALALGLLGLSVLALYTACSITTRIAGGELWNGIAPEFRNPEIYGFGIPLIAATVGSIVLSWCTSKRRDRFPLSDIALGVCATPQVRHSRR